MSRTPVVLGLPGLIVAAWIAGAGAEDAEPGSRDAPPPLRLPHAHVLFVADFRKGSLDGWQTENDEVWSVRDGALCADLPDRKQVHSLIYAGAPEWEDYAVDLDLRQVRGVDKGLVVRVHKTHGVGVDLRSDPYNDVVLHHDVWKLGQAQLRRDTGGWHHLRVEARGSHYRVLVDGVPVLDRFDSHHSHARGQIALAAYTGGVGRCSACYANVIVTDLR